LHATPLRRAGNPYGVGAFGMPFPQLKLGVIVGMSLRDIVWGFRRARDSPTPGENRKPRLPPCGGGAGERGMRS
jgi:hypothetical protein